MITKKKIQSKIPLTYNTGLRTQGTSVITGRIVNVAYSNNFEKIGVAFIYTDANGVEIARNAWTIEGQEQIDGLFTQIEPLLPPDAGETQNTLNKFYQGFLQVAADNWGTDLGDWEIVDDIV